MAKIGQLVLLFVVFCLGLAAFWLPIEWPSILNAVSGSTFSSWSTIGLRNGPAVTAVHWAITPELWDYVESLRTKANVPGISFGVVRLREAEAPETEFGTWGLKTEDGESVTPDTLYSIGSCSKAFVSASLGLLIDDFASGRNRTELPPSVKKLTWDTKVASLLPDSDWSLEDPYATAKANLRDVLSHMSGLARHDLSIAPRDDVVDAIKRMRHLKSPYELREKFQYSNQMYSLVTHIISTYSGQPFTDFVSERIFKPLNMSDSTYDAVRAEQSGKLSHGWAPVGRRIPFWKFDVTGDVSDGPGGIISSAVDVTKWAATLINDGVNPWTDTSVIPKSVVQETTTSSTILIGRALAPWVSLEGYGMGWARWTYRGHELVGHDGGIMGFNALVLYLPWDKIGIVGFASVDGGAATLGQAAYRILDQVLGLAPLDHSAADAAAEKHESVEDTVVPAEHPPSPDLDDSAPLGAGDSASTENGATAEVLAALEAFAGTYGNIGYGSFALCAPTSTSEHCKDVLATFASIPSFRSEKHPLAGDDHTAEQVRLSSDAVSPPYQTLLRPGLYGHWPRWVSSHIVLFPLPDAPRPPAAANASAPPTRAFSIALPALYPHGFGRNTTPFASYVVGTDGSWGWLGPRVECTVVGGWVRGCGLFTGPLSGDGEQSVEERAEAWFTRE
ncbi:beta-lactamase/transpeptidase-like protein [Obba rivulosa]|uniref:Beta-lactamase/transpeptidase-like protein n=1 Tax=Obba rivulosa TaxID=1052685 RepID=A0A8E2ASD1_9APHY|nr:beta-lactamase/transpeptidase-like protein [Obba rivulosa]